MPLTMYCNKPIFSIDLWQHVIADLVKKRDYEIMIMKLYEKMCSFNPEGFLNSKYMCIRAYFIYKNKLLIAVLLFHVSEFKNDNFVVI